MRPCNPQCAPCRIYRTGRQRRRKQISAMGNFPPTPFPHVVRSGHDRPQQPLSAQTAFFQPAPLARKVHGLDCTITDLSLHRRHVSLAPKTGPRAKVYNRATHPARGGAEQWSRNGGDTWQPTSSAWRWKRFKAARRLASYRVNTRFMPT